LLRPGRQIVLVNISRGGALIHSTNHLKPGARTELQLLGRERHVISGRIDRCRVIGLNPLRYEGAIVFDDSFRALDFLKAGTSCV
jgi:hypothetical protein